MVGDGFLNMRTLFNVRAMTNIKERELFGSDTCRNDTHYCMEFVDFDFFEWYYDTVII